MNASHFRPCIDLHHGAVKQIVGGTLTADDDLAALKTNFVSAHPASYYADLYRTHDLRGAHVIKLGPGNDEAARSALAAWPNGLQVGGGINLTNAAEWLAAGASHVIVTSWLFEDAKFQRSRLAALARAVGRDRVVVDLSCRRQGDAWVVAMDKWTKLTDLTLSAAVLADLATDCAEFLVHAADVEGLCQGVDADLVRALGEWSPIPVTYAGGGRTLADLELVHDLSGGRVDLTIGSALDIFGGTGVTLDECVAWNRAHPRA
ncbi:Enzyme that catalyzes the fourth step in the histidine pathway [Blastocladiella emersonii ATCC 22665]|nr:Enzyme that catalyzes the fourth step in the histidine pathway [Blastocladiella emersonii ATCC 22665]